MPLILLPVYMVQNTICTHQSSSHIPAFYYNSAKQSLPLTDIVFCNKCNDYINTETKTVVADTFFVPIYREKSPSEIFCVLEVERKRLTRRSPKRNERHGGIDKWTSKK